MALGSGPVLAEPAQRLVARIIDLGVVGLPLALVAQELLSRRTADVVDAVGLAALVLIYDSVLHARWGRTLGKRLVGIRVVSNGEGSLPPEKALARAAVFAVPMALRPVPVLGLVAGVCWVAGVALVLRSDQERRALHDRLAGTIVVTDVVAESPGVVTDGPDVVTEQHEPPKDS